MDPLWCCQIARNTSASRNWLILLWNTKPNTDREGRSGDSGSLKPERRTSFRKDTDEPTAARSTLPALEKWTSRVWYYIVAQPIEANSLWKRLNRGGIFPSRACAKALNTARRGDALRSGASRRQTFPDVIRIFILQRTGTHIGSKHKFLGIKKFVFLL